MNLSEQDPLPDQVQVLEDVDAAAGTADIAATSMLAASTPRTVRPTVKSTFCMAVPPLGPCSLINRNIRIVITRLLSATQAALPHNARSRKRCAQGRTHLSPDVMPHVLTPPAAASWVTTTQPPGGTACMAANTPSAGARSSGVTLHSFASSIP